jgi:hypothetical protein
MKTYTGTCHCGRVVFTFKIDEIVKGIRCNCSICRRLGVIMSMKISPEHFRVLAGRDCIKIYLFGDKVVNHSYCTECGIYVFYEHEQQCRVNLGCVEEVDISSIETLHIDGKSL